MRKIQKGFTLVELIVVIAIIAVLAGVVLVVINPAALLAKGRDARRLEDLDALHKAISLAIADNEIQLKAVAASVSEAPIHGDWGEGELGWVQFTVTPGKTGLSKYLPTLPTDPINGECNITDNEGVVAAGTCQYTFASTTTTYEINAVLESPDNAAKLSTDGGNNENVFEIGTSLTIL